MTLQQQQLLEQDLDAAIEAGELLARRQISESLEYLRQALRFQVCEIRMLVEELLAEQDYPERNGVLIDISTAARWVN